jgi:protein-L-isoaspartate(D-aspartate) O-methyltransferase
VYNLSFFSPKSGAIFVLMLHTKVRKDDYLHKGRRKKLLDELAEKGITDEKVLEAMNQVPRHFFLDPAFEIIAYENRAFPIGANQTISHPYTVAFQTQLLQVKKFDKVLEIGTGSAYQSCVLAKLGARVFTIERQKSLYEINNQFFYLKEFIDIKRFLGDGFKGLPGYAPFDKILVTCGAPFIPESLLDQLKIGGCMVVPVGEGDKQIMYKITKLEDGFVKEEFGNFSFVPMLEGINR